jgi:hypothetical protein
MLSHCANPQCSKPFLRLREGKLFVVETRPARSRESEASPFMPERPRSRMERYWLCEECAAVWTLVHDPERGVRLAPLPRPAARVSAAMSAKWGTA